MTPARLQTIEEIFHSALDQEPDQISVFLDTACEGDELLRAKSKLSSLHINEQAASLKLPLSVSRRRLSKMGNLICSSVTGSATTNFLNGSAPAGWVKSIWRPT